VPAAPRLGGAVDESDVVATLVPSALQSNDLVFGAVFQDFEPLSLIWIK
jgi:hypothetical protein